MVTWKDFHGLYEKPVYYFILSILSLTYSFSKQFLKIAFLDNKLKKSILNKVHI